MNEPSRRTETASDSDESDEIVFRLGSGMTSLICGQVAPTPAESPQDEGERSAT